MDIRNVMRKLSRRLQLSNFYTFLNKTEIKTYTITVQYTINMYLFTKITKTRQFICGQRHIKLFVHQNVLYHSNVSSQSYEVI